MKAGYTVSLTSCVLAAILAISSAAALEGEKPVPEGQQRPYEVVRKELLELGWKAFKATHFDYDSYCLDDFCKIYPEVLNCTGGGAEVCELGFFKSSPRRYLIVVVSGETAHHMKVVLITKPTKYDMDWFQGRPQEPAIKGAKKL